MFQTTTFMDGEVIIHNQVRMAGTSLSDCIKEHEDCEGTHQESVKVEDTALVLLNLYIKENANDKYFEMEAISTNIGLYDLKEQVWKLSSSHCDARSPDDIYSLLQAGDHRTPDNHTRPTRRDILFIALLTAMNTSSHSKKWISIQMP